MELDAPGPAGAPGAGGTVASRLRRLRGMGLGEIVGRARQEASKLRERAGACAPATLRPEPAPVAAQILASLRESAPARFFPGASSAATAALLARRAPHAREELLAAADAAAAGRFDLLGHAGLSFGHPIDWRLDPVSGRRSPLVHWSRIDPLDPEVVGDSKVVWELSRHQWMVSLGQAYRLTGDERHARAFAEGVRDWIRANPVGMGINWASSLEAALRLISWSWATVLFLRSAVMTTGLFAELLAGIRAHASHVSKYLSYYFSPNTHLTGEALGLFYAGVFLPELPQARRWRALGARILAEESQRQVLEDGVYFEQSTCYQRYTVEIALHFLVLAAANGRPLPRGFEARVQGMVDFLVAVRQPRGAVPSIGDADGGWLLPLARRAPGDLRGIFSTAAVLFRRPDYAWASDGRLAPETLWMLGAEAPSGFDALRPAPPSDGPSRVFPSGGYVVMRSGWGPRDHQLVFDTGPLGCPVSAGHGHADLLSIQCAAFGEPCLVDPGTGSYAGDPGFRDHFRSTAAHSTVTVDGLSQAAPAGLFGWRGRPQARLLRRVSSEGFEYALGEHDGYARLPDPVRHRRGVLFLWRQLWIVVDELRGAGEHSVALRFQFVPLELTLDGSWARARGEHGGLLVRTCSPLPLQAEVRTGEHDPIEGWVSPDYGRRTPAPVLSYSARARLPLRIVTLLVPVEDGSGEPPLVTSVDGGDGCGPAGLAFGDGTWVRFDGDVPTASR